MSTQKFLRSIRLQLLIVLVLSLLVVTVFLKIKDIKRLPQTGVVSTNQTISRTAQFTCEDQKKITAVFSTGQVELVLSDGRQIVVQQATTADGERYASLADEFVFWTKGISSFVQEGQQTTFANCSEVTSSSPKGTGVVTTQGELVCLPHRNKTGPQTTECAFGLKATNGTYYGLKDGDRSYKNLSTIPMNKKIEVTGIINLTSDSIYEIVATITVQSIKQL